MDSERLIYGEKKIIGGKRQRKKELLISLKLNSIAQFSLLQSHSFIFRIVECRSMFPLTRQSGNLRSGEGEGGGLIIRGKTGPGSCFCSSFISKEDKNLL